MDVRKLVPLFEKMPLVFGYAFISAMSDIQQHPTAKKKNYFPFGFIRVTQCLRNTTLHFHTTYSLVACQIFDSFDKC